MATLLESGARPYGSTKGIAVSMLIHGGVIAAAVVGTATVVLPPRERVEEHPVLYVAPPPPKLRVAPEPLPAPPKSKAPAKAPSTQRLQAPQPKVRATPALVAPPKVGVSLPAVDLKAAPTISDVVAPAAPEPISGTDVSRQGSVKSSDGGETGGGLGSGGSGHAYSENQVDRAVEVTRSAAPRYPDALKSVGVEGVVVVRFIVGADGRVEPGSIETVSSPHKLFTDAVRTALLNTRYRPAEAGGHAVRQLAEQAFTFRLDK